MIKCLYKWLFNTNGSVAGVSVFVTQQAQKSDYIYKKKIIVTNDQSQILFSVWYLGGDDKNISACNNLDAP